MLIPALTVSLQPRNLEFRLSLQHDERKMNNFFDDASDNEEESRESFFTQAPSRPVPGPSRRREVTADIDSGYDRSYRRDETLDDTLDGLDLDLQVEDNENIVQRLSRRWMDERSSPELLQSDPNGELDMCLQTLLRQVSVVSQRGKSC